MKILILTDSYPPEIRSASHLMQEFAMELRGKGHDITVATTMPRYNLAKGNMPRTYDELVNENGVRVIRVATSPIHNVGYFKRGFAHLLLPIIFYYAVKRRQPHRPDIIIAYSPPLTLGVAGIWLKRHFRSRFVLNVQDIFPQNAIDLGIMRNYLIIKFFTWTETWIYKRSDKITVHSDGNKEFLTSRRRLPHTKVEVIYNWIHSSTALPDPRGCAFREKMGLGSKFVIVFAGVLGPSQGLDAIIDAARELQGKSKASFVFLGDGTEKERLMFKARELRIRNCIFEQFVGKDEYAALLGEVDVGLVCLSRYNRTPVVPGKMLGYMAAGLPVLAVLNKESDGHDIIKKAQCGISVCPDDTNGIVCAVLELERNNGARKRMGNNGLRFARTHYTVDGAMEKYGEIFEGLIREG